MKIKVTTAVILILSLLSSTLYYKNEASSAKAELLAYIAIHQTESLKRIEEADRNDKIYQSRIQELLEVYEREVKNNEESRNSIIADYTERVRKQSERTDYYRSLSESKIDSDSCNAVITRVIRYDGALEEGRDVVTELRKTIRSTDRKLELAVEVMKEDRAHVKRYSD